MVGGRTEEGIAMVVGRCGWEVEMAQFVEAAA